MSCNGPQQASPSPVRRQARCPRRLLPLAAVLISLALPAGAAASSGTVWSWGANSLGELGDGTLVLSKSPESVLAGAIGIAGGADHSLALLANGQVDAWGYNRTGQLGTSSGATTCDTTATCTPSPQPVSGLSGVVQIAAGDNFSLALLSNGTVMSWGDNDNGQLGTGDSDGPINCGGYFCSPTPVPVVGLSNVKAIAAGGNHALALLDNGTVMAWGANNAGQLGDDSSTGPLTCSSGLSCNPDPAPVVTRTGSPITHVIAIAAGASFSLALAEYSINEVLAWGDNRFGELGQATVVGPGSCASGACSPTPVLVRGLSGTEVAIAANGLAQQALALESDGTVAAWGNNRYGAAGSACGTAACPTPKLVPGVSNATAIATSGVNHSARSLALEAGGQVVEWGTAPLGNGTLNHTSTPVTVAGVTGASAIAAGGLQSLVIAAPPRSRFGLVLVNCQCRFPVLEFHLHYPGVLTIHQPGFLNPGPLAVVSRKARALLRPVRISITKARTVRVRLHLTAAGRRALRRRHKLRVGARITFVPRGGHAAGKTITVTFRRHRRASA